MRTIQAIRRFLAWLFAPEVPFIDTPAFRRGRDAFHGAPPLPGDPMNPDWRAGYAHADLEDQLAW